MSGHLKPGDRIIDAETYAKLRADSAALATLEAWLHPKDSMRSLNYYGGRHVATAWDPSGRHTKYAPTLLALAAQLTPEPKG